MGSLRAGSFVSYAACCSGEHAAQSSRRRLGEEALSSTDEIIQWCLIGGCGVLFFMFIGLFCVLWHRYKGNDKEHLKSAAIDLEPPCVVIAAVSPADLVYDCPEIINEFKEPVGIALDCLGAKGVSQDEDGWQQPEVDEYVAETNPTGKVFFGMPDSSPDDDPPVVQPRDTLSIKLAGRLPQLSGGNLQLPPAPRPVDGQITEVGSGLMPLHLARPMRWIEVGVKAPLQVAEPIHWSERHPLASPREEDRPPLRRLNPFTQLPGIPSKWRPMSLQLPDPVHFSEPMEESMAEESSPWDRDVVEVCAEPDTVHDVVLQLTTEQPERDKDCDIVEVCGDTFQNMSCCLHTVKAKDSL